MAGPWDKYSTPSPPAASANPWEKYAAPPSQVAAVPEPAAEPPVGAPAQPGYDPQNTWGGWAGDVAASTARGLRRGVAMVAGAPVEILNASPMIANILPGEQGVGPLSDRPVGGFRDMDEALRFGSTRSEATTPQVPDYEPQTVAGRFANRVGEEIGATAVPLAAAYNAAGRVGVQGARQMAPIPRAFVEPMAVNPGRVAGRELAYATAAGTGAQTANELIGGGGDGEWWSDLLGSVGGMTALGVSKAGAGLARNIVGSATGNTRMFDDVAGSAVVDRLINNSTQMQEMAARTADEYLDTTDLARRLQTPSAAETVIPGFRANIADRTSDAGLSTLAYNIDAAMPGAANARRVGNAAAIDGRMSDLAPQANPAALREAVAAGAQGRIDEALAARAGAASANDTAVGAITPQRGPVDRGYNIRAGLAERLTSERDRVTSLFGELNPAAPVDMADLNARVTALSEGLPLNDRLRFSPSETGVVEELAKRGEAPLSEVMAVRSGLSSDIRAPGATDQQRRITGQYLDEVEAFIRDAVPEQADTLARAREARLDVGRRFEDRGAVPDILRETGRGQYAMPNEAVPGRVLAGPTDYSAVMREAGENPAARQAVADQIKDDAIRADATRSPEALARFMQDRNFALTDFPEVRSALEQAGASRKALAEADAVATRTAKELAPGGPSPAGQYLRYDDTGTRQAIGTAWKSAQPERAVRELLEVAGDTPATRQSAKAALWTEVAGTGQLDAPTMTSADGVQRWSGRKLDKLFKDPRFAKTADVLWEDNPEHLADLRGVVDALAKADGSIQAKAPASSGTAQSITGKFDPALSTASVASRMRSVNRGQLSPTIGIVDLASTALRSRSAKVQSRAIDELMARAINDPELAAALLRKFNPADEAAERRAFLTKFGVRLPTVANIIAGGDEDDDDAIKRVTQ